MSGFTEGLNYGHRRLISRIVDTHWKEAAEKKNYTYNELLMVIDAILREEGKPYNEGEKNTINFGYNNFRMFVQHLLYRNLANYDSMVLLTATKGGGKSSAAIMIAKEWCNLIGIQFNPARHIAYNNSEVMTKIDILNPFEPLILDESIRFISSEDWAKCVSGDTLIKTPSGNIKIKDLAGKRNFEVCSYNVKENKEEIQIAEKCIHTKNDYVYELETETGEKIKATKEHKFLTSTGWKELQHLKPGDEIIGI